MPKALLHLCEAQTSQAKIQQKKTFMFYSILQKQLIILSSASPFSTESTIRAGEILIQNVKLPFRAVKSASTAGGWI
ncbi:MAG: hypothetical protein IJK60_06825 [Clostridia bacterium]|nr:hypothetical protein [Clostridia bacterium]